MRSIHDNIVYAYSVLCEHQRIVLNTEFRDGKGEEYTDIEFTGVIAHHFEDVLRHNILFDIDEVDVEQIVREWSELFDRSKNYGWPNNIEYRGADDLIRILKTTGVKAFDIGSSYGMFGFVLAAAMEARPRESRAVPEARLP